MRPDLLRIAASLGVAYLADPVALQNVLAVVDEPERRRLIDAGRLRFSDDARRASDGEGEGVAAHPNKHDDV